MSGHLHRPLDDPTAHCVHHRVAAQAALAADEVAVIAGEVAWTYGELQRRAGRVATTLQDLGVGPDARVAICVERSPAMMAGVLGILEAGGAYVPLDPAWPAPRLAAMLEQAEPTAVLTQTSLAHRLDLDGIPKVCLDTLSWDGPARPVVRDGLTPDHLAYVIYTSGSTGRPKGIAMPHRPLVNLLDWQMRASQAGPRSRTLQFTSLSFDVSFQEIFSTWCTGGTLVLITEDLRHDPSRLWDHLCKMRVERLFLPFVALQQLAEAAAASPARAPALREVITAGEQLKVTPQIASLFGRLPDGELHNHYGPAESHVVTAYVLPRDVSSWPTLPPIGRPIDNTVIHLLDGRFEPVPPGEVGELFIGGSCLARGYLGRADLTAERFLPDPLDTGQRLYRTGDLARLLPDGNIEFLGRADDQVKIRGHRVEPAEVEAALSRHEAVEACAVTAREDRPGDRRLVAYVVTRPGVEASVQALRGFLGASLPEYMVPAAFVLLPNLPLTPSGKVDRRALPAPARGERPETGYPYVAPRTDAERRLASIWEDVLDVRPVGARDNFFDLGGQSLHLADVLTRLRREMGIDLPAAALFEAVTLEALARRIDTPGLQPATRMASAVARARRFRQALEAKP